MKRVAKDKYNQEIKNGDIIDVKQTINGCRYFVVIDLDKLDVRYYDNNHQGVGFDSWVAIDRKYEYDVEELLDMKPDPNWGFILSEIEVVGRLSEEELIEAQKGSSNSLDLSEEDIKTIIETNENPPEPNEKLKEAFKTYNIDIKKTKMSKKTIAIIELSRYDGKYTNTEHMYFETKPDAERYLKGNGYESDDIFGWKKDYFHTAKIRLESLNQYKDE